MSAKWCAYHSRYCLYGCHKHKWTEWMRPNPFFDYMGNKLNVGIATVTDPPETAGFTRYCSCGEIEVS